MAMPPDDWMPLVYDELRKLAAAKIAGEMPGVTLDATALVHEAWLKLQDASAEWNDRAHFFRAAAMAMRRIMVDRARAKHTQKRSGGTRVDLDGIALPVPEDKILALDEALDRFAITKPDHARLVEMRFFIGMKADEAAMVLGVAPSTVDRMWSYAKAWLQVELRD
jgi:RNA polymerase sigma factor (TIGR02999 family)